jgi:serine/threonine protein kinase
VPSSTRIGPYRVLRLINQGGQGRVYLGYDSRLQRRVAIKVHRLPTDRAGRKRLLREAQLVASIESPKVVQIYDLVVAQSSLALIMEYVPGCDLEEFLCGVRPSVSSVMTIATDLAGAITAARQQGIVHGDLKARNVLVTQTGRVKLTDFGIARSSSSLTPGSVERGSPGCVSPEQYLGKPLDVRSDLFALGCLLYRMLAGSQPFLRSGQLDPNRLLNEMPQALEELATDLPAGLPELVSGMLQKDPDDRPRDTREVRFALRNIARGIPLTISSSLLAETRSCFRTESPGDVPPIIPSDLRSGGRSRLRRFKLDEFSSWRDLIAQLGFARLAVLVSLAVFLTGMVVSILIPGSTRVHIDQPLIQLGADIKLPGAVSSEWIVEQVKEAMTSRLGPIFVTGPVGGTEVRTLYASPQEHEIDEQLSVALRCSGELCLFSVVRRGIDAGSGQQTILFLDMPVSEWRQNIQQVTATLFD